MFAEQYALFQKIAYIDIAEFQFGFSGKREQARDNVRTSADFTRHELKILLELMYLIRTLLLMK